MGLTFSLYYEKNHTYKDCKCKGGLLFSRDYVFEDIIPHSTSRMAEEAGVYDYLWNPSKKRYTVAIDITNLIEISLSRILSNIDHFELLESEDNFGTVSNFVVFLQNILVACKLHPEAKIQINI